MAIRLAIAPFFAHPLDVYTWYYNGQDFLSGKESLLSYLVPYRYSYFLFAIPATWVFNILSKVIPPHTIPVSALPAVLNPGSQWNISLVPGILFDFIIKLPLILSDTLVACLLYKITSRATNNKKSATFAAAIWFLNPLTIWVSSGWGTFDTLPTLFTVLALYFLYEKRLISSGIAIVIAAIIKYYAFALIIPFLILSYRIGARRGILKSLSAIIVGSSALLVPSLEDTLSRVGGLGTGSLATGLHYSGISVWTSITLFYSKFDQSIVSSSITVVALIISYYVIWRQVYSMDSLVPPLLAFSFPTLVVLLLFRFVGENFLIWILPFLALYSIKDNWIRTVSIALSALGLVSSVTNSLLPYYMLPVSPWLATWMEWILRVVNPYRVSSSGSIAEGLTTGKLILMSYGILAFLMIGLLIFRIVSRRNFSISTDTDRAMIQ